MRGRVPRHRIGHRNCHFLTDLAEVREACDEPSFEVPHSSQNLPFVGRGLTELFASHPPVEKRIEALLSLPEARN